MFAQNVLQATMVSNHSNVYE